MTKVKDFIEYFEEFAPNRLSYNWDNCGLLVGDEDNKVKKVLVCLDVTPQNINKAINEKIDLIVSHHPLIRNELNRINNKSQLGKMLLNLIRNDISVISLHTNLDVAKGGVNDVLADILKLNSVEGYEEVTNDSHFITNNETSNSIGRVGYLNKELTAKEFAQYVKNLLSVKSLRLIGNINSKVKKIAVLGGSFDGNLKALQNKEIDIIVTGDIKYHVARDIEQIEKCAIDAGHFGTEHPVVETLKNLLIEEFKGVNVIESDLEFDPYYYI